MNSAILLMLFLAWGRCQDDLNKLRIGYSNVFKEFHNASVTIEEGAVPPWLSGTFIRCSCGAFGDVSVHSSQTVNHIEHLLDCIDMGTSFQFYHGRTTFYNKYYNTRMIEIWRSFNMNMTTSGVFFKTLYSHYDEGRMEALEDILNRDGKVPMNGHEMIWRIGNRAALQGLNITGHVIDPHRMEMVGTSPFDDTDFFYSNQSTVYNNPPHYQEESDGTIWSLAQMLDMDNAFQWTPKTVIWKVWRGKRSNELEIPLASVNLMQCYTNEVKSLVLPGYVHSFAMTEQYLIIPQSSLLAKPCLMFQFKYDGTPLYDGFYEWEPNKPSKFFVIRKRNPKLMATIDVPAFLVSHQLNAFEDGSLIHMDMITYPDSQIIEKNLLIKNLMNNVEYHPTVERFTLNILTWKLVQRQPLRDTSLPPAEMPFINPRHRAQPYKFAYLTERVYLTRNAIVKLNVETKEESKYTLPSGLFALDPFFIAHPNPYSEDDGILLVQGIDGNQKKAFLIILDARIMKLIGRVTAPGLALFGTHSQFFPPEPGTLFFSVASLHLPCSSYIPLLCFILVIRIIMMIS